MFLMQMRVSDDGDGKCTCSIGTMHRCECSSAEVTVTWSAAVSCQLHKLLLITHCELRIVSSSSIWTEGVIQNHEVNLSVIQDHSVIFSCGSCLMLNQCALEKITVIVSRICVNWHEFGRE